MFATLVGVVLLLLALFDAFESMVLPRRVTRRWRPTRLYYRLGWLAWRGACHLIPAGRYRENMLSIFGPLSLLGLFICWVVVLIFSFSLIDWGLRMLPGATGEDFRQYLYHSGETFFTLGYGDVTPTTYGGKLLSVVEAGTGFGFMALIIGYLPVLYQAFSRREVNIGLLDARAGSPPTASELLRRSPVPTQCEQIERFLIEWEQWAAELLESHLSYPVLSFYRSQHDNQSWLAALAFILDVSAVQMVTRQDGGRRAAELTFAIARHASVDLCLVFWLPPRPPARERLTAEEMERLLPPGDDPQLHARQVQRLNELRVLYEPFIEALSEYFCFKVPRFFPERNKSDNWQTTPWTKRAPGITELPAGPPPTESHF
jgi:hypothetical protein